MNGFYGNKWCCSHPVFAFDGKDQRETHMQTLSVNKAFRSTFCNLTFLEICSKSNSLFSGKDGSRAFVTGQFNEEGLTDDISDFTPHQMHEIHDWKQFYSTSYTYLGLSTLITVLLHLLHLPGFVCIHSFISEWKWKRFFLWSLSLLLSLLCKQ